MKAYTDIEQSKRLAEILPPESADMEYLRLKETNATIGSVPFVKDESEVENSAYDAVYERIPCWSLAALLGVVPYLSLHKTFSGWRCDSYNKEGTSCILGVPADNPVDACYEMILKLHELNLL